MLTTPELVEYGDNNPREDQWLASLWLMMCGANLTITRPASRKMTSQQAEKLSVDLGLIKRFDGEANGD